MFKLRAANACLGSSCKGDKQLPPDPLKQLGKDTVAFRLERCRVLL